MIGKSTLLLMLCLLHTVILAQDIPESIPVKLSVSSIRTQAFSLRELSNTGARMGSRPEVIIDLPGPDGKNLPYRIAESNTVSEELKKENPTVRSFEGVSKENPRLQIAFTISPMGLSGILTTPDGYVFLDHQGDAYELVKANDVHTNFFCGEDAATFGSIKKGARTTANLNCLTNGAILKRYRIAIATTGEFTQRNTNPATAFARVQTIISLVNALWKVEASVEFQLVTGNRFCFPDPDTDVFSPAAIPSAPAAQTAFNGFTTGVGGVTLPYNRYDIGHVLHFDGVIANGLLGRGVASFGSICRDTFKGSGWSQYGEQNPANPSNNARLVQVLAHEFGHQLGVYHTFNSSSSNCNGNRKDIAAYEPGAGITLMSYAPYCSPQSIREKSNYLYIHSRLQALYYVTSGTGNTCGTTLPTGNTPPVVNAGINYTIPKGTPFTLTGSATDVDGDPLTYRWEQYDLASDEDDNGLGNHTPGVGGLTPAASTTAPLFRSRSGTSPSRTFPDMDLLMNATVPNDPDDNEGEDLPQVARKLTFRLSVLDAFTSATLGNMGGASCDEAIVTVVDTGPFRISNLNKELTLIAGCTSTLTWDVNNTNQLPVNCARINIDFSADEGATWTTLVSQTPNDGSQTFTVPSVSTTKGRFRIKAANNIFFDINDAFVTISANCVAGNTTLLNTATVNSTPGNADLQLSICPAGDALLSVSGTIAATDPAMKLTLNSGGACATPFGNTPNYAVIPITVNASGSYTFTFAAAPAPQVGIKILNIYKDAFDASSSCTNWIASNIERVNNQNTISPSISVTLSPCTTYYLVVSGFATQPNTAGLGNFKINFSGSGEVHKPWSVSQHNYSYVIVDLPTNTIKSISETPDLTNPSLYPSGSYRVYGVSNRESTTLSAYVGQSLSALNTALANRCTCGALSSNSVRVEILGPTPVELLYFRAEPVENQKIKLSWSTKSERNTALFQIDRGLSADVQEFLPVASVPAAQNSTIQKDYEWIDENPLSGINYYRLRQLDEDGTVHQNRIVSTQIASILLSVSPNPTNSTFKVTTKNPANTKLELYDTQGRNVGVIIQKQNDQHTWIRPLHKLTPGVYQLRIISQDQVQTVSVVFQ